MKEEKKYTEEFKKSTVRRLKNGESILYLSKELSVNKKTLQKWLSKFKDNRVKRLKTCHKKYTTYKAHIENKKGTVYDSKLGGIPYIPEGKRWITCSKCKKDKVLILQLNINDLPDVSIVLREYDFVQVFACMKPSEVLLEDEESCDYAFEEWIDEEGNMHLIEPFNLYFDIQLVKKDKEAKSFVYPPWIDGYNLFLNEQEKKVESNIYNDQRSYAWAEQHCFEEKIITKWEKLRDVECTRHFEDLSMCSASENSDSDLLGLLNSYWIEEQGLEILAYEKLLEFQDKTKEKKFTSKEMEEFHEKEKKIQQIMNCPCCDKPLTLLFQFSLSDEKKLILKFERDSWNNNVYALFYCEDEPEVMSCQWVGYGD